MILDLYGARSRINRVDYDPHDSWIREIRWSQIQDDVLRLEIVVDAPNLWGYGEQWSGDFGVQGKGSLVLKLRRAPRLEGRALKNRIIILDPGHGGAQPGAIGPTRLLEKSQISR